MRDLLYDWPLDKNLPKNGTFLWGSELKITVNIDATEHKAADTFEAYFPEGRWFDLNS